MVFKIQESNQSEWIDTTHKATLWKQVHLGRELLLFFRQSRPHVDFTLIARLPMFQN